MGIGDAVRSVLGKYATFSGRARRSEFWWWVLATFLLGVVIGIIRLASHGLGLALEAVEFFALIVPNLAVGCRRLHDTGRSGWLQLLVIIPIVGIIVLIVFWCGDSNPGDNAHGPNPKGFAGSPDPGYPPQSAYPPGA